MVCCDLVHVAGLTDVAIGVVDGAERFFAFWVCAVPGFGAVECVCVDVVQQGFEAARVLAGCEVAAAVCVVSFVVYEASRVAAEGDGDGRVVDVADVFGEVGLLLDGERVPRVGERLHGGEVSPGVPGGGSVSVVTDGGAVGCVAGGEYGKAHVGRVDGVLRVSAVLAFGGVDSVSGGSRVDLIEGADGAVAAVGVVDVDSRVGVLGEYARVGFAVNAGSVSDSKDAARLLDARLLRRSC